MSFSSILGKGLAAIALLALPTVQATYPDPGSCSGECWAHDPAVFQGPDGSWFRFTTGSLIGIYKADALEGPWTYKGSVIDGASSIDLEGNNDLWVSYCKTAAAVPFARRMD